MSGMNIDLSLDEIISKGKSQKTGFKKGYIRRKPQNGKYYRIRGKAPAPRRTLMNAPPDKIMVSNLAKSVTQDDINALFEHIGRLKTVQLNFDSSGKSKGTAFVVFNNPGDAQKAIREYHNRPLDGQPMKLELVYKVSRDDYMSLSVNKSRTPSGGNRIRRGGAALGLWRRGRRRNAPLKTREDLNAEMDDYMKGKNAESMDVVQDRAPIENGTQNIPHQSGSGINLALENALTG